MLEDVKEQKDKLGLELSDIEGHNVNDDESEEKKLEKRRVLYGRLLAFILGIAFCAAFVFIGCNVLGWWRIVPARELDAGYGKYFKIMKMIGEDPLAEVSPKEISDEELKEIVAGIGDPYAEYYTKAEYEDLQKRYTGDYVGIGIGIVEVDGDIVVMTVFEDTPAEAAGIQPEDIIVKVDGKGLKGVDEAVEMISGKEGTDVTVTVRRDEELMDFTVNRQKIEMESVSYNVLEDHSDIGYIKIVSFSDTTDDDFISAVKDLKEQGCSKYIIDLRDNGGGLTDVSIRIADYLLPACRIMSENKKDGTEKVYNSKTGSADLDMVVLVNENTASASEILAGALQDNNAATIIGSRTYGKGVTQLVHQFEDGTAVKLTAAEYFRPSGKTVQGIGVIPDVKAYGDGYLDAALRELRD